MAKKNAAVPPAVTPAVPKTTKESAPAITSSLTFFFQWVLRAWGNCKLHLPRFTAEIPLYTEQFVDDRIAYVKEVKALPNNRTRKSVPREVLLALKAAQQAVLDQAARLEKAINKAYVDAGVAAAQRSGAGLDDLPDAKSADYAGVSSFIETANTYLSKNLDKLVRAEAVNPDFATNFEAVGTAFDLIWGNHKNQVEQAMNGTDAVKKGIRQIKKEYKPMLEDAAVIFKYEPELLQLFEQEYLLSQVRTGHIAGIKGSTKWPAVEEGMKPKPQAGILVEVLNEPGKTATTDKQGRYKIKLAGGTYQVRFSGEGIETVVQKVVVNAGMDRIVNLMLTPPVVVAAAPTPAPASPETSPEEKSATPPPASNTMDEVLAKAMKDAAKNSTNGEVASQNGQ